MEVSHVTSSPRGHIVRNMNSKYEHVVFFKTTRTYTSICQDFGSGESRLDCGQKCERATTVSLRRLSLFAVSLYPGFRTHYVSNLKLRHFRRMRICSDFIRENTRHSPFQNTDIQLEDGDAKWMKTIPALHIPFFFYNVICNKDLKCQ